jgi:PAS domain S-box-containing protein
MTGNRVSAGEYQQLVEQAPIMIWRSDLTMGCDYFNERWLAFTGRSLELEMGNGWIEGVHKEDFDRCLKIYTTSFGNREIFEMEYRLRRHDGVYRWIFDRGVPFHDAQGQFAGYIGSCIDITDRVEAQEALKKAQQAEMDRLKRLFPICAWCHKIRDDHGYWNEIEVYLAEHEDMKFTHGLCTACAQKYFPDTSMADEVNSGTKGASH